MAIPPISLNQTAQSKAEQVAYGNGQDGSGWTVNFSGAQNSTGGGSLSPLGLPWWVWAAAAGVVAWRLSKSRK